MLFYIKKYLLLEITVTLILGGCGIWGIKQFQIPVTFEPSPRILLGGALGAVWLTIWTFMVQNGYRLVKGKAYARQLTASLAKEYVSASFLQVLLGGITAACGEELFFRGFIQGKFGILAGSLLFMLAHMGKKDIRIVSIWSFPQGFFIGLFYAYFGNLLVPMIAHGSFDIGGMVYFHFFMKNEEKT
jgi:membrane protease YdiL (CAAX protease family)